MRAIGWLVGLLSVGVAGAPAQESKPRGATPVERARRRVLDRTEEGLRRAQERLVALGVQPPRAEEALAQLSAALERILAEELGAAPEPAPPPTSPPNEDEAALLVERRRVRASRGGFGTEEPLALALAWLEAHQSPDGRWAGEGFWKNCRGHPCDGAGSAAHDVGATGLAVLALLGDGSRPGTSPHRRAVGRAVAWLLAQHDPKTGLFGSRANDRFVYDHAIATLALAEFYRVAGTGDLARTLRGALDRTCAARNPFQGWRYGFAPDGESDSSVTAWMVLALQAARKTRTLLPKGGTGELRKLEARVRAALDGALDWFDQMTDAEAGRCGYRETGSPPFREAERLARHPPDASEATTAAALLCRLLLGQTVEGEPAILLQAERLRRRPPMWEVGPKRSTVDEVYWFFGTYAALGLGGEDWEVWNLALKKALLENQRREGDARGSWDPAGAWGSIGGRVCMTALMALCLEAYLRGGGFFLAD